ncbi:MAG: phosphoglycerate mutase, partial [Candidatus Aenigmatarchaeota archaeon]
MKKTQKKKVVFLVIDGLADLPINNKTPLSEARKPNLDYFASNGLLGQIIPVKKSYWNELTRTSVSHIANISLLGFNPYKLEIKRGPLEAVGANIPYTEGHLAVRCNFATVDKELTVLDRHIGRNFSGLDEIARTINEHVNIGVPFVFMRTYGHRAVLIIKEKLSDKITDSDPYYDGEKVRRVEPLEPEAKRSAELVQKFLDRARELIEFHPANEKRIKDGLPPANYIITREAGNKLPSLPNFSKKYKVKAVCIAENGVMKATCLLAGFNAITVPELKFQPSLKFIFDSIDAALAEYDFVYAHIKGPDEPAHDGDFH